MPQITIDEMKYHAAELVRSVREQRIEYVIVEGGSPVALLSPTAVPATVQKAASVAAIQRILDEWRANEPDDEMPFDDFLAFLEQNRLDLRTES